jgi:hypothetical protein
MELRFVRSAFPAAAALVLPATPFACAWAGLGSDSVLAATALAAVLWLVVWVQRCHSLWGQPPGGTGDNGSVGSPRLLRRYGLPR